jgi:hypothetical protein
VTFETGPGDVLFLHGLESPIGPDGVPCGAKASFLRAELRAATPNLDTRVAVAQAHRILAQGLPWTWPLPGYEEAFAAPLAHARAAMGPAKVAVGSSFGAAVLLRLLHEEPALRRPCVMLAGAGPKLTPHRTLPAGARVALVHGLRDDVVPVEDSIALFASSPDAALLLLDDVHGLPSVVGPPLLRSLAWCLGGEPFGHPVPGVLLRPERDGDAAAIRAVHLAASEGSAEADRVDGLRGTPGAVASLVAERAGSVVGHALFVRARVGERDGAGLGPLAVHPDHQGRHIGAAVATAGLDACRVAGRPVAPLRPAL